MRKLKMSVSRKKGTLHTIHVMFDERTVAVGDGGKAEFSGEIPDEPTNVLIHVTGVPGSTLSVAVDLPEKVNDFKFGLKLAGTELEADFDL